jgi:hypothetical protein
VILLETLLEVIIIESLDFAEGVQRIIGDVLLRPAW